MHTRQRGGKHTPKRARSPLLDFDFKCVERAISPRTSASTREVGPCPASSQPNQQVMDDCAHCCSGRTKRLDQLAPDEPGASGGGKKRWQRSRGLSRGLSRGQEEPLSFTVGCGRCAGPALDLGVGSGGDSMRWLEATGPRNLPAATKRPSVVSGAIRLDAARARSVLGFAERRHPSRSSFVQLLVKTI
jgi:hypothetical protein